MLAAWKRRGDSEPKRIYLGASIIGYHCDAYIWLTFRGCFNEKHEGVAYRLFHRGKREEAIFVDDLRSIGVQVWDLDIEGKQYGFYDLGGHFCGHLDGVGINIPPDRTIPHLLEFKTHNSSSYKDLVKKGVLESKPQHYDQMTIYMGEMSLTRALYLAVNKDTDELYSEIIEFDKDRYDILIERARRIITSNEPVRCADRPDDWRCKMCAARDVCWNTAGKLYLPDTKPDCRTCCHSTPVIEGDTKAAIWSCKFGHDCGPCKTCRSHVALPSLINGYLESGSDESVVYRVPDPGTEFNTDTPTFVNGAGGYSTEELSHLSPCDIKSGVIDEAKRLFDGTVVGSGPSDNEPHPPVENGETLC